MAVVKTTYDFDQMLSNAREAYGEELLRMAEEGLDFVFTYSDNVAPSTANPGWPGIVPNARCAPSKSTPSLSWSISP